MKRILNLTMLGLSLPISSTFAGGQASVTTQTVNANAVIVPGSVVVSQFAVPVAVPQYAVPQYVVPIAPPSYVQYGGTSAIPNATMPQANATINATAGTYSAAALEDRIVNKILRALRAGDAQLPAGLAPLSFVKRACVECHSDVTAKGNLNLAQLSTLSAERRLTAIARVLSDDPQRRMPPAASDVKLSADELGKLLQELSQVRKDGE